MVKVLQDADNDTVFDVGEVLAIETVLAMGEGYVLDFSDKTFNQFVYDNWHIDATASAYTELGTSKANRLRGILRAFNDASRADVLKKFLEYRDSKSPTSALKAVPAEVRSTYLRIVERLEGQSQQKFDAQNWTGVADKEVSLAHIKALAPHVLSGLDELIEKVEDKRFNDPEVQERLQQLRELRRHIDDLINAIERGQPIGTLMNLVRVNSSVLLAKGSFMAKIFGAAPALSIGVSYLMASIVGIEIDSTLLGSSYGAIVAAEILKR